jgi:aspartate aminotransferase
MQLVAEIPDFYVAEPDGAFYIFPMVNKYFGKMAPDGNMIDNADDLCMYLLNTAHVSTVTGSAFGEPNCIRISFANSLEKIEKAYERIKAAMAALK